MYMFPFQFQSVNVWRSFLHKTDSSHIDILRRYWWRGITSCCWTGRAFQGGATKDRAVKSSKWCTNRPWYLLSPISNQLVKGVSKYPVHEKVYGPMVSSSSYDSQWYSHWYQPGCLHFSVYRHGGAGANPERRPGLAAIGDGQLDPNFGFDIVWDTVSVYTLYIYYISDFQIM